MSATTPQSQQPAQRVLFIGNSYTAANDLPAVFAKLAESAGEVLPLVKSSSPGGRTLSAHMEEAGSLSLIDEGKWDVVVLQGQSQEPALAEGNPKVREDFLRGATALCARVREKSPKARIYFYETWARHADYWKDDAMKGVLGADPKQMQARLRKWYGKAAEDNLAKLLPVGDAWELSYAAKNPLRLHVEDNSHPNFAGTYLAAAVMVAEVYGLKKLQVEYSGELNEKDAERLRGFALRAMSKKP